MIIAKVFLLLAVLFFHSKVLSQQPQPVLTFTNNGERVALFGQLKDTVLSDINGQLFSLNQRLIVKSKLSAEQIKSLHKDILNLQLLAKLREANIYWLTLKPNTLPAVLTTLQAITEIIAVQPDVAPQGKSTASHPFNQSISQLLTPAARTEQCETPKAVRVAIIDDGFDFSHQEFSDLNVLFSYDVETMALVATPQSSRDYHGNLVAGLIVAKQDGSAVEGGAPDSELIAIRQVTTWTSSLIIAFNVAKMMKAQVVNCSWVMPFMSDLAVNVIDELAAMQHRPYIVVAAGNEARPACEANHLTRLDSVIVVGAKTAQGTVADFSNFGPCVDVFAPFGVLTTGAGQDNYRLFGGTSSAAALVSASLAQALSCDVQPTLQQLNMYWNNSFLTAI